MIHESNMPVLKSLAAHGAYTWQAETIFPPKTLPSHTSMFTGLQPAKHRVLWNNYEPDKGVILAPTVFTLARRADPNISTAFFSGKMKLRHLLQDNSLDIFHFKTPLAGALPEGTEEIERSVNFASSVAEACADYIVKKAPQLCGIHFPDTDDAGHKFDWGSPEQKAAFERADQALGVIVNAIKQAGIDKNSVLILTADHGGHGKGHGERIPDDMQIPWIAWGKGVKSNFEIKSPICTVDSTATALWLLGLPIPAELDGKPVKEAFEFPANPK